MENSKNAYEVKTSLIVNLLVQMIIFNKKLLLNFKAMKLL